MKTIMADTPEDTSVQNAMQDMFSKLGARDRANLEKHLAALDAEPDDTHSRLWRRIVTSLWKHAPMPVQLQGTQAIMFFIADGKYRMQVFAVEDKNDGLIAIYLPDVLTPALEAGVILRSKGSTATDEEYGFNYNGQRQPVFLRQLDAANTPDPAAYIKHMIGWNRKAIRVTIPAVRADSPQLLAVQALAAVAAKQWAK